jgi:cell shape-determining protein MreD
VLSVLQDVILGRMRLFGATTELVPCGILMICLAEGLENGSVFSLIASSLYVFSGSSAGYHTIALATFLCVYLTYFRQSYLRKGFAATMLCTAVGMMVYELVIFMICVVFGQTRMSRIGVSVTTGLLTLLAAPILYPLIRGISTIGGEAWKE